MLLLSRSHWPLGWGALRCSTPRCAHPHPYRADWWRELRKQKEDSDAPAEMWLEGVSAEPQTSQSPQADQDIGKDWTKTHDAQGRVYYFEE